MSAGLMIEVIKYAPKSLTAVEWKALMVLADDANDKTRVVFTDIENQKFLDEMDVEANRWRSIRAALKRKGVIVQESAGFKGHRAKFRIAPLRPAEEPEPKGRENDAPFEPKDARNPTQRSADLAPQTGPKARGNEAQRRADPTRPTPPTPQNQEHSSEPPPPAAAPPDWFAAASEGVVVQEEGEGRTNDPDRSAPAGKVVDFVDDDETMHRARLFVDKLPHDRQPTALERAQLAHYASLWLAEGWTHDALMAKCEAGLEKMDNRISVWRFRLQKKHVIKQPSNSGHGHKTWQDPAASAYRPPKREHVGWQNPTDPDAYEGTF